MTIATAAQFRHRRSLWKQMQHTGVRKQHQRRVAVAAGLAGASKAQLREAAEQAYAEFVGNTREGDPKPSSGDLSSGSG